MLHTCPKCGFADVRLSKRRTWERILRLRALRCVACYHRFLTPDEGGLWSLSRGRMFDLLLLISLLGLVLAVLYFRLPLG
jgi:hypothetical protein